MKKILFTLLVGWLMSATAYACNYCSGYGQQVTYKHDLIFSDIVVSGSDAPVNVTLTPQSVSVAADASIQLSSISGYLQVDQHTPKLLELMQSGLNIPSLKIVTRIEPEKGDSWVSSTLEFHNVYIQYMNLDFSDGNQPYISFSLNAPDGIAKSSINKTDDHGKPSGTFIEYQQNTDAE